MLTDAAVESGPAGWRLETPKGNTEGISPHWYALYTRSHCEQLVHDQLAAKGLQVFLPKITVWSRRGGQQCLSRVPLFPSYLFLHQVMDKASFVEVHKARGLVCILGERWDCLMVVPDAEIATIQRILRTHLPLLSYPYLREGQRVRITHGLLTGVEGFLIHTKPTKGLLVLSVDLLQRSVAIEVDCTAVVAV